MVMGVRGVSHAVGNITRRAFRMLDERSYDERERWTPVHERAAKAAEAHFRRLHHHSRLDYVAHAAHIKSRAGLAWELSSGKGHRRMLSDGVEALRVAHLERLEEYSSRLEEHHERRAVLALRAIGNLAPRDRSHARLVTPWLEHRSDQVALAACDTLRFFEGQHAEDRLIAMLRRLLDGSAKGERRSPQLAEKGVHVLLEWKHVRQRSRSEAVRQILRTAWVQDAWRDPSGTVACGSRCRQKCNPHQHTKHCRDLCASGCARDSNLLGRLAELVRRGLSPEEMSTQLDVLIPRHAHTAHPSRRALTARSYPGEATVAPPGGRHRTGRELASYWEGVSFDDLKLTFIDTVLRHEPVYWNKVWGDMTLLGDLGGCTINADVEVDNKATLRVGLFGGHFGFDFHNLAQVEVHLLMVTVTLFKANLDFKWDATYRVDVPDTLLKSIGSISDSVSRGMTVFESTKDVANTQIKKLRSMILDVSCQLDDLSAAIPAAASCSGEPECNAIGVGMAELLSESSSLLSAAVGVVDGTLTIQRELSNVTRFVSELAGATPVLLTFLENSSAVQGLVTASNLIRGVTDQAVGVMSLVIDRDALRNAGATAGMVAEGQGAIANLTGGSENNSSMGLFAMVKAAVVRVRESLAQAQVSFPPSFDTSFDLASTDASAPLAILVQHLHAEEWMAETLLGIVAADYRMAREAVLSSDAQLRTDYEQVAASIASVERTVADRYALAQEAPYLDDGDVTITNALSAVFTGIADAQLLGSSIESSPENKSGSALVDSAIRTAKLYYSGAAKPVSLAKELLVAIDSGDYSAAVSAIAQAVAKGAAKGDTVVRAIEALSAADPDVMAALGQQVEYVIAM